MGFLVDTSIWVDVERGTLAPGDVGVITRDEPIYISPVTIAELKFGVEVVKSPVLKQKRHLALERLKRKPICVINETTGDIFGSLAAQLNKSRGHKFRVQDLWMASQAIQHGFKLLTNNIKDFEDIPGLDVVSMVKH